MSAAYGASLPPPALHATPPPVTVVYHLEVWALREFCAEEVPPVSSRTAVKVRAAVRRSGPAPHQLDCVGTAQGRS